ncbi:MAG: hypothetical protein K9W45_01655 [Candidatus Heimdallarchaeum aukensis]|uniref:Uncharacterized protein n=1 Tax=Candidatus Heimdallarchaeum aukensis TaxID=2876573 RepID=A0A9Y1BLQ9_9ARCH|nr:MAG: hypothetical protein K9W45_01655 [Candidatus Heimdallarchaeum aukensis]
MDICFGMDILVRRTSIYKKMETIPLQEGREKSVKTRKMEKIDAETEKYK